MSFKAKEFDKSKFEPRTSEVPVPGMQEWFDGPAVWKVRGLSGNELGRCNELAEKSRKNIAEVVSELISQSGGKSAEAVRDIFGLSGDDVPIDVARRLEYMIVGSVDPVCDLERAIKFNEAFPVEFRIVSESIYRLTGLGHVPGKPKPSGSETTSSLT